MISGLAAALALGGLSTMGTAAASTGAPSSSTGAPSSPAPAVAAPRVSAVLALGRSLPVRAIEVDHGQTGEPARVQHPPLHGADTPGRHDTPDRDRQPGPTQGGHTGPRTGFPGTGNIDGVVPPDPDGAVGPNDYVELVNTHYQVFSKTGASLAGPIETAQLFSRFSSSITAAQLCYTNPGGDGIVLYDRGADRWLISELAFASDPLFGPTGPYVQCFAVSQTGDPTGAYYTYAFLMDQNNLPDYPKIGIWGNSYYLSANLFTSVFAASGNPAVWAFDRTAMLTGGSPQSVEFAGYIPSTYNTVLPADVDGANQPPAGSPEVFAGLDFATNTTLGLWEMSQVNWANPGAATFSGPITLTVAPYNTLCGLSQDCLAQRGTTQLLDAISDRVMYRLAYRNFGDHEALVVDHSVNVSTTGGNQAGVRWYEIDRALVNGQPSGSFFIAQQGTYAPDGNNRWMASMAMDGAGDIAMGYSLDSATMYPSIAYTGRLKCDPANQMTVAEGIMQQGGGAQTGFNRWGDYTRMAVDPVDDSTFWYVDEYYTSSSASGWQTAVGSFKLPSCLQGPDTTPPTVALTAPTANSFARGTVTISANASDDRTVANVQFLVDGKPLATVMTPPYQTNWDTTSATTGAHTIEAIATDGAGLAANDSRSVTVDNVPPTVSVTSPAAGAVVSNSVQLAATASDGVSGIAKVDFLVDGNVVGTSTTAPYTATWTTTTYANGGHTVTARATDGAGNVATSAGVNVTVQNAGQVLHIVSMNGYGLLRTFSWRAWADVTVDDQTSTPVSGVTVTFTFSGGTATTRTCTTNSSGYCSTSGNKVSVPLSSSETIVTTNVVKAGATWNGQKFAVTMTP
jgi:hypothetical protein